MKSCGLRYWVAGVFLASSGAACAQTYGTTFIVDPQGPVSPGIFRAQKHHELVTLTSRASQAVTLDGAVRLEDLADMKFDQSYPLTAGQILLGSEGWPGTYCALMSVKGLGATAPCLFDDDQDGVFDRIALASRNGGASQVVLLTSKSKFTTGLVRHFHPLASPVGYTPVSYTEGQTANLHLAWSSNFNAMRAGAPVTISFWLDTTEGLNHTGVSSQPIEVVFRGTPITAKIEGVSVRILGFEQDGSMRCELLGMEPHHVVKLYPAAARPVTIYIWH